LSRRAVYRGCALLGPVGFEPSQCFENRGEFHTGQVGHPLVICSHSGHKVGQKPSRKCSRSYQLARLSHQLRKRPSESLTPKIRRPSHQIVNIHFFCKLMYIVSITLFAINRSSYKSFKYRVQYSDQQSRYKALANASNANHRTSVFQNGDFIAKKSHYVS
jgi:hypothetical protein